MRVIASITTSVDGYVTGPEDGAAAGLGVGGERLHYWVMGGPWTYDGEHDPTAATGVDKQFLADLTVNMGAGICGRGMYESAGAWGGTNPFGGTLYVLTHRVEDAPDPSSGFVFVGDLAEAMERALARRR
jgi:dihydrofolate reductase